MKKAITSVILAILIVGALPASAAGVNPGSLVKGSSSSVYYITGAGNRLAFPNESVYQTWYPDFSGVIKVSDSVLAGYPLVGMVWYRPGSVLVKVRSAPQVYAVAAKGVLRPVASEGAARDLYGENWNKKVNDLNDAFFINYTVGKPIVMITDYSPASELAATPTIAANGAGAGTVALPATSSTGNNLSANSSTSSFLTAATSNAVSSSGRIMSIAVDPESDSIAYIGSASGGIYKTTDRGDKWASVADNLNSMHIAALAIDPSNSDTVYAGTGETYMPGDEYGYNGVYVTKDGGTSWSLLPGTQPLALRVVSSIALDPTNSNHIYLGTDVGVYETKNWGTAWKKIADGFIENLMISDKNPREIFATGASTLVMRSTDAGVTWDKLTGWNINHGFPVDNPWFNRVTITQSSGTTVVPGVTHVLYAALADPYELYRSDDEGDSWHEVAKQPYDGMRNYVVLADPENADVVFNAGTVLNRATDGGWTVAPVSSFPMFEVRDIVYAPGNSHVMYAATDTGMCVSMDGGMTWTVKNEGLDTTQWYSVSVGKNGNVYGAVQDHSLMYRDTAWNDSFWGDARKIVADPVNANVVYALSSDSKGIGRSEDFGKNFSPINGNITPGSADLIATDPTNGGVIYVAAGAIVYRSTDSGASWDGLGNGGSTAAVTAISPSHAPDQIIVGRADGTIQAVVPPQNSYTAAAWSTVYAEPNKKPVADIVASADSITAAFNVDWGTRLVRLTHVYDTWKPVDITGDLVSGAWVRSMDMDIKNPGTVYVGTLGGAFVGREVAPTKWVWSKINGIPLVEVTSVALDNANSKAYFATWGRGLYEITK
jgi:photosystem II stability/assembly factor-like uncharacterized protein